MAFSCLQLFVCMHTFINELLKLKCQIDEVNETCFELLITVIPMKWLGGGDGDVTVKVDMDRGPQRTQDDAAVGYVFQRPPDPEFPQFGPKQARWALGDDSIIDVSIGFLLF